MNRSPQRSTPLVAILFCLGWLSGCDARLPSQPDRESRVDDVPPNIVFITIDTLRADRIGAYGYFRDTTPSLDALARESVLFERCYAPMATTFPAHLSLFTSTYPNETGAIANVGARGKAFRSTPRLRTLAQRLREHGYQTAAFVSAAPLKKYSGIHVGFDVFTEPEGHSRTAEATNADAFEWLAAKPDGHFLLWVHYFDPHWPYVPPKRFADKFQTEPRLDAYLAEREFAAGEDDEMPTDAVSNYYDAEVSYVDEEAGKLLDALRAEPDAWNHTIVVVLSDHGEGLRQHGELEHGGIWGEQLHAGVFARVPSVEPKRIDRLMSTADVIPTLMGLAEIPGADGFRSQASGSDRLAADPDEAFVFSQESSAPWKFGRRDPGPRYVLTGDEWKYVFKPEGEANLFRLSTDPHELDDVIDEHPEIAARLHEILSQRLVEQEEKLAAYEAAGAQADAEIDPEILEQMRALGYIE